MAVDVLICALRVMANSHSKIYVVIRRWCGYNSFFQMPFAHLLLISFLIVSSKAFIGEKGFTRPKSLLYTYSDPNDDGNIPSFITSTVLRQVYPGMFHVLLHVNMNHSKLIYCSIIFEFSSHDETS